MQTLFLLLMLLVMVSTASAQDMPDIVRVDVDLTWNVPSGPVRFFGNELWKNGVGYVVQSPVFPGLYDANRWQITGVVLPNGRALSNVNDFVNFGDPAFSDPALARNGTQPFYLHFEASSVGNSLFLITVPFNAGDAGPTQTLKPGDYDITRSTFVASDTTLGQFSSRVYFADSGSQRVVPVPELAILRSFTKHIGGRQLNAALNPALQRITAWGAAALLRVPRSGDWILLPSATLEVQEWCSGIVSMKWLMLLALGIGLIGRMGIPWTVALVVAAALVGVEVNVVRVTGVGAGIEWFGVASRGAIKEWTSWGAMVFGVAQVIGLGWVAARRNSETVPPGVGR
jgi:exosortase/archaeosortase family protein